MYWVTNVRDEEGVRYYTYNYFTFGGVYPHRQIIIATIEKPADFVFEDFFQEHKGYM